jgi:hypothetical protein
MTLQEYLEMVNLQRRKELFMMNEIRDVPNPMSLDTSNKLDLLVL